MDGVFVSHVAVGRTSCGLKVKVAVALKLIIVAWHGIHPETWGDRFDVIGRQGDPEELRAIFVRSVNGLDGTIAFEMQRSRTMTGCINPSWGFTRQSKMKRKHIKIKFDELEYWVFTGEDELMI